MLQSSILESARKGIPVTSDLLDEHDEPLDIAEDDDEPDVPQQPVHAKPVVAVPELARPGESQSNGLAERAVQALEDQARTLLVALEARIKVPIPSDHAVLTCVVEHAS